MIKLGTWPSDKYFLSWVTQRLVNRAPEISHARQSISSIAQQIVNPIGQDIERMTQQIIEERNNIMPSVANIDLLDHLYKVDLKPSASFSSSTSSDGSTIYNAPSVYATLENTEYELTQASKNNLETLSYNAIPSRVENGLIGYAYTPIIPSTLVSDLASETPADLPIPNHLYVTLSDNTNWEIRSGTMIYFPKIFIKGITRKGTNTTEAIPLRYNGTFKTINQWKSVEEVFVSYLDSEASISIDIFPWLGDGLLDTRNLSIDSAGQEKWRFINMKIHSWGHTFISEAYTTSDFDIIRKGIDAKDIEHEIELLDSTETNVTFDAFAMKPHTDYLYAISNDKFYIYNTKLAYPDVTKMAGESPDVKMDLYAEKWIFARNEEASIRTRILSFENVPVKNRWKLLTPSGQEYYIGLDGSFWPITTDAWIENKTWDEDIWLEQNIYLSLTERGTYIISIECMYVDDDTEIATTLETKYLFYVPSAIPELTLDMPASITNITDMSFDSDGKLWVESDNEILLLNVYYDYFIADYTRDVIYLSEQYASVRVEV